MAAGHADYASSMKIVTSGGYKYIIDEIVYFIKDSEFKLDSLQRTSDAKGEVVTFYFSNRLSFFELRNIRAQVIEHVARLHKDEDVLGFHLNSCVCD